LQFRKAKLISYEIKESSNSKLQTHCVSKSENMIQNLNIILALSKLVNTLKMKLSIQWTQLIYSVGKMLSIPSLNDMNAFLAKADDAFVDE